MNEGISHKPENGMVCLHSWNRIIPTRNSFKTKWVFICPSENLERQFYKKVKFSYPICNNGDYLVRQFDIWCFALTEIYSNSLKILSTYSILSCFPWKIRKASVEYSMKKRVIIERRYILCYSLIEMNISLLYMWIHIHERSYSLHWIHLKFFYPFNLHWSASYSKITINIQQIIRNYSSWYINVNSLESSEFTSFSVI